jgi:pyruvate/2-oxoacid:ferredoxin oxidoreductase alpha subunit
MSRKVVTIDGNEAAAYVAHKANELTAIYPIKPSLSVSEEPHEGRAPQDGRSDSHCSGFPLVMG